MLIINQRYAILFFDNFQQQLILQETGQDAKVTQAYVINQKSMQPSMKKRKKYT